MDIVMDWSTEGNNMFGKTIKLSKEVYEDIIAERDKARKELEEHLLKKMDEDIHRQDQYY